MIPQHYPVEEGKIYAGEYPGARSPEYAEARLKNLIGKGIRTFVDLTAPADDMEPYDDLLAMLGQETSFSLRRISLPIRDMGIPQSTAAMQAIMDAIRGSNEVSPAVYIHCWGGIGRTGTAVGCWLRECGYDAEAALEQVQNLYSSHMEKVRYNPESPQTREQRNYIRHWKPVNEKGGPG
ncbi:MAG: protein-tyrosine phosphatase family protein [Verrucomicrobiota bacterium]